jgi:hypothetical protein
MTTVISTDYFTFESIRAFLAANGIKKAMRDSVYYEEEFNEIHWRRYVYGDDGRHEWCSHCHELSVENMTTPLKEGQGLDVHLIPDGPHRHY